MLAWITRISRRDHVHLILRCATADRVIRTIVLTLVVAAAPAHADESSAPAKKSPNAALILSLVPTLVGSGLLVAGIVLHTSCNPAAHFLDPKTGRFESECSSWIGPVGLTLGIVGGAAFLVGPSLGHLYTGSVKNRGLATRVVGLVVAGIGGLLMSGSNDFGTFLLGGAIGIAGGTTLVVGTLMELSTTRDDARTFHARLSVAPIATRTGAVPGLVLGARF